jgi:HK97 family phage prohead protease/HK97 family phage major capsid protein
MPMKPHKGESQSDFMSRCMKETFTGDRPQDQAVAICMNYWRDEHGGKPPSKGATFFWAKKDDMPSPETDETRPEFMDRCVDELASLDDEMDEDDARDACEIAWDENRAAAASARHPVFHKTHTGTVVGMEFILSDETPDRMGDVIASDGWDIAHFKKNPIALFNHRADFPIGKWHNLRVEKGALRGHLELAPKGTSPRIDEIRALVDAGILQAVSVGFRPIESRARKATDKAMIDFVGEHFTKQELIETSLVSVPANPNALAVAKALNISRPTLDLVFAKHGNRDDGVRRRTFTAKHGDTSRNGKGGTMSALAQRIADLQEQIANKTAALEDHLGKINDANVSDADLNTTNTLNAELTQLRKTHEMLVNAEKAIGQAIDPNDATNGGDTRRRALVTTTAITTTAERRERDAGGAVIVPGRKKEWEPLDYLVKAGVISYCAKVWGQMPDVARMRIAQVFPEYGTEETKTVFEWMTRAASAPAMTTVTGWAAELVQQVYTDMMALLLPKSVFPRLSAKGLTLSFGRAGKIIMPTRSRTPTIAGSFVGEGMAIPVRQGAFTAQTFIPKKMAVITTWTREMDEHSIPAIEGVLRQAIQEDTAVAIDTVLLDANAATTIRPAGILAGVAATGATAGGGLTALIGDIKALVGALTASTYGNIRNPTWLMNPSDVLSAALSMAPNTGIFPFKEEIGRGTLANLPIIDSATVPVKTLVLIDAADFVTMQGDNMRFEMSDQATLHMEDTSPADLVGGSPAVTASPQRSLFQTDSLALRMILPLNWAIRRGGTVAWTQNVTWS